jgi:SsrA-binding protein
VKSLRESRATLQQAYADVRGEELWLIGAHRQYAQGNVNKHDPDRDRKLLLHKKEIASLIGRVRERGFTLVPTPLLEERQGEGRARAGQRQYPRQAADIARRDADRQIERALRSRR